jgi:cobaltochelatase CobS
MTETKVRVLPPRADLTEYEKLLIPRPNPHYFLGDEDSFVHDVSLDILEKRKVILTGHKGTGKTSTFTELAARVSQPVLRSNMNGQTTISDFVGTWTATGGETVWVDGALPTAMRRGYWLIIDEVDCAEPAILAVLNSVAEKNGTLFLKEKGNEVVTPHDNFRLLCTANTVGVMQDFRHLYLGTNVMNDAFLDRFRVYEVKYLKAEKEVEILTKMNPQFPVDLAKILVRFAGEVREAFNNEQLSSTFSLRQLIDFSEYLTRQRVKEGQKLSDVVIRSAERIIYSKVSPEEGAVMNNILTSILPKEKSS